MAFRETQEFSDGYVIFSNGAQVRFRAPVAGIARQRVASPGRMRIERTPAEQELPHELQRALDEHEVIEEATQQFELRAVPDDDVAELVPPATAVPEGFARVLLYRDESGGISWHFPQSFLPLGQMRVMRPIVLGERDESSVARIAADARNEIFRVPMRTAAARTAESSHLAGFGERSIFGHLGRKIFKFLLLPIAARVLAEPMRDLLEVWEKRYRPEMLRTLTPQNLDGAAEPFTEFEHLASGRALLVVHGIFSSTRGMLSRLAPSQLQDLHDLYGGRVIAFDHFTLSRSPRDNARLLLEQLARTERHYEFDILCHSRGGIVARALRELGTELHGARAATFHKIFFAATPNHGSALANVERIHNLLDVFTNIGAVLTGGAVAVTLELVMAALKLIAYTGITEVPGIAAMAPGERGFIEGTLNARAIEEPEDYAAVAANFEPNATTHSGFFIGADNVIDRVFGRQTENDLVVPTRGVFSSLGANRVDIDHHVYRDRLWHTELFGDRLTIERAIEHFRVGRARPRALEIPLETNEVVFGKVSSVDDLYERTAEAPAVEVERIPEIRFHERVESSAENELIVRLSAADAANFHRAVTRFLIDEGRQSVEVRVELFAPGFDVRPGAVQTLTVGRTFDANAEIARYHLIGHVVPQPTRREITADFSIAGVSVGGVAHVTWVAPPGAGGGARNEPFAPRFHTLAARREAAELKIVARDKGDGRRFAVSLTSGIPGFDVSDLDCGELTTDEAGAAGYIDRFLAPVINARPDPAIAGANFQTLYDAWQVRFLNELTQLGNILWGWLPADFQRFYFELHDAGVAPRSIQIVSDDMLFPWELVVPWRNVRGRRDPLAPLGMAHALGRWRPGLFNKPEPQRYPVAKIAVINPKYAPPFTLPASHQEAAALEHLFGTVCEIVDPCDSSTVQTSVLRANGIQIVHFTGHANFDASIADRSALLLVNNFELTAAAFGTSDITAAAPIVVLNACSVGQSGLTAGRASGFAEQCLKGGCSAVIATYWPVTDVSARDFSIAFYTKLRNGQSFGEALQELRFDHSSDSTYQAYTFFGDPLARIVV
ncbi:MAG TPA: CHAT domain-containing protein [Thermoanaerobaculia bacterium]|nr:CHAT domain-containing protein [Thermoanaerobaculia bacterium]